MIRMMTSSVLAGALVLGLASSAFAARSPAYGHAEYRASRLADDPAPRRVARTDECTINGTFLDSPYCFGGDRGETGAAY